MNIVNLMGRLTSDPELRRTTNDTAVCRFTVAVNRKFKNQNGEYDADFISCQAWKATAEHICRYWHKGDMICLSGSLRTGSYQDKNHPDVTHYTTEVAVNDVYFCGGKKTEATQAASPTQQAAPSQTDNMSYGNMSDFEEILSDGDVPF